MFAMKSRRRESLQAACMVVWVDNGAVRGNIKDRKPHLTTALRDDDKL
jgi:hypothetical protein